MLRLALRDAVAAGELELAYQPKIDLARGRLVGAEGLLRWTSREYGPISPAEFVPLAEASGDIVAIGEWVLDTG
ncbi:EAL domain-containing protein, partial [Arthrospira platensis SPKY2]